MLMEVRTPWTCGTHEWGMQQTWMGHVTHMNESCQLSVCGWCNTLQHAATRYNTLQHAATSCNTCSDMADERWNLVAGCCRVWLWCCRVLQCVPGTYHLAVCCGVLRCVAVCCSVWQRATVCGRVLQCVAMCCRYVPPRRQPARGSATTWKAVAHMNMHQHMSHNS